MSTDFAGGRRPAWVRTGPLSPPEGATFEERWECRDGERALRSWPVRVTIGKPLNVMALKGTTLAGIEEYAASLARTAADLYGPGKPVRPLTICPACAGDAASSDDAFSVFGVAYRRCGACSHVFVGTQPRVETLEEQFAESDQYAQVYADPKTLQTRIEQVVLPKLRWTRSVFRALRGRDARSVLDVGAGAGHFVHGCRQEGLRAEGVELSRPMRRFASQAFDLELRDEDFLAPSPPPDRFDLVTMWGLLEYTPEPRRFLEAALRRLEPEGLVVVEVPRADCLGSVVQTEPGAAVARHLDPTSHVNCFSDASLATALAATGYRAVAAWYFGMDAYEWCIQAAHRLASDAALAKLVDSIPRIQSMLDAGRVCDDIVVAAVPER